MSVAPYPEYKDSGVEWIGAVPAHWNVLAIKRLSPVQRGASPRPIDDPRYFDDDGEFAWVRIADVTASDGVLRETTQRLSALGASLSVQIAPGELFISIAGSVGKPCIAGIKACIHDGFVYFPRLQDYRGLLFRIFEAGHCYAGLGKMGTQLNLNTDTIGAIKVPVASPEEQSAIAAFLDQETGKIDALVAEQERLIALLKEKRQTVISQAVTKGLNPNAPMKDSGIEWLGQVPAHWAVVRIKSISLLITSGPRGWSDRITDNGALFIQSGDLAEDMKLNLETAKRVPLVQDAEADRARLRNGDVVICITGAKTGNVAICDGLAEDAFINQHLSLIRPNALIDGKFMGFVMKADVGRHHFELSQYGLKQGLSLEDVGAAFLALPPLNEQKAILTYLASALRQSDTLITEATQAITLLRERRAALISAAVTGKIDVRSLAPTRQEAA